MNDLFDGLDNNSTAPSEGLTPELVEFSGHLQKMAVEPSTESAPAQYRLLLDQESVLLNPYIGTYIELSYLGTIHCSACGRKSRKSYGQGHCYPCFKALPQCDRCIMSPELCHYHLGSCRDPAWGERFCMSDHIVYLSNASGLKVGITRATQMPTRWLDQGAIQAMPLFRVATRRLSGQLEDLLRQSVSDRTNWRTMLKGQVAPIDLIAAREQLYAQYAEPIQKLCLEAGVDAVQPLFDAEPLSFDYPVQTYPEKIVPHNFDKTPVVSGRLQGIKGQYLLLDSGVINLRKFTSYQIQARLGLSENLEGSYKELSE